MQQAATSARCRAHQSEINITKKIFCESHRQLLGKLQVLQPYSSYGWLWSTKISSCVRNTSTAVNLCDTPNFCCAADLADYVGICLQLRELDAMQVLCVWVLRGRGEPPSGIEARDLKGIPGRHWAWTGCIGDGSLNHMHLALADIHFNNQIATPGWHAVRFINMSIQ